ncbi:hypothetical protein GCM10022206_81670 [Streptomyces chiangmaiensis]
MPTVVQLPAGKALTVRAAADAFLDSLGNPNTVRSCSTGVGKTAERIGKARPLGLVADDEIGEALELLWGTAAVNTWSARRAAVLSWLGWCEQYGYDGPSVPALAKRLAVPDSQTPARSKTAVDRLIARREVHLREKTLWRMLYATAGQAEEILGANIEELDSRGAAARSRQRAPGPRPAAGPGARGLHGRASQNQRSSGSRGLSWIVRTVPSPSVRR